MRFGWRLVLTWLLLATAVGREASAQRAFRAGPPQSVKLQTKDGVGLSITYYPSRLGKEAAPVVMLHDYKDSQGIFSTLAQRLQSPGQQDKHPSFAVVTVDLRGHGGSAKQTAPDGSTREIDAARLNRQDIVAMAADMEAVRSFLVGKNDAEELNLNKLSLVGVGMGATVAVNWAAQDWVAPPLSIGKQGQDVKALVLVSPRWNYRGVPLQRALKVQPLKQYVAWMLIFGEQDSDTAADVRRKLYRQLERFHPEPASPAGRPRDLMLLALPSALEGSRLLSQAGPRIEDQIIDFLTTHVAEQDYPWSKRRNRLQ
jgi:pimeloyl-ACP methyl ester carboxylesterase